MTGTGVLCVTKWFQPGTDGLAVTAITTGADSRCHKQVKHGRGLSLLFVDSLCSYYRWFSSTVTWLICRFTLLFEDRDAVVDIIE